MKIFFQTKWHQNLFVPLSRFSWDDKFCDNPGTASNYCPQFVRTNCTLFEVFVIRRPAGSGIICALPFLYRRLLKIENVFFLEKAILLHHSFWIFQRSKFPDFFLPKNLINRTENMIEKYNYWICILQQICHL